MLNWFQHLSNCVFLLKSKTGQTLKQVQGDDLVQGDDSLWSRLPRQAFSLPRNDNFCKGFTLAEVLLVITIIGVVASLTIPGLITNIQDRQTTAALKKVYSTLSNATISVAEENGGNLIGLPKQGWVDDSLKLFYYKYLNVIKQCTGANVKGNCWHNDNNWFFIDGTPASYATVYYSPGFGAVLTDGTFVSFCDVWSNCDGDGYGGSPLNDICTWVTVDLNGFKKPNTYSKDIFEFYITKNRVVPRGIQGDWLPGGDDCISSGHGEHCAFSQLNE